MIFTGKRSCIKLNKRVLSALIFILISILLVVFVIIGAAPKWKANNFFNSLEERDGFSVLDESINIFNLNDGIDVLFDKALGYNLQQSFQGIEAYSRVSVKSKEGEFIAEGMYYGYWKSWMMNEPGDHIINIYAPEDNYSKIFRIDSECVRLDLN